MGSKTSTIAPGGTGNMRGRFLSWTPSFKIGEYEAAVDHYVEWLGFNLDWEWRAAPDQPVIIAISRDGLTLFLNESGDEPPSTLRASVANLQALAAELNERRPGFVEVFLEQPYEIPTAYIRDPFGNSLAVQQTSTKEDVNKRDEDSKSTRAHIRRIRNGGVILPSANALADELGVPLGVAVDALNEFTK